MTRHHAVFFQIPVALLIGVGCAHRAAPPATGSAATNPESQESEEVSSQAPRVSFQFVRDVDTEAMFEFQVAMDGVDEVQLQAFGRLSEPVDGFVVPAEIFLQRFVRNGQSHAGAFSIEFASGDSDRLRFFELADSGRLADVSPGHGPLEGLFQLARMVDSVERDQSVENETTAALANTFSALPVHPQRQEQWAAYLPSEPVAEGAQWELDLFTITSLLGARQGELEGTGIVTYDSRDSVGGVPCDRLTVRINVTKGAGQTHRQITQVDEFCLPLDPALPIAFHHSGYTTQRPGEPPRHSMQTARVIPRPTPDDAR